MEADRWVKIDCLLDQALERLPTSRAAFLAAACDGDDELRCEVESLLEAHAHPESFLGTPALNLAARNLADERQAALVGKRLGTYEVISVLGVGGMGEVYLARDERLNRKLALKFLPEQFTRDKSSLIRFEREARAASALNHPNIITIFDIGVLVGNYFIAAEYVEGPTLRQLVERGPIRAKEAISICSQIADALSAAHGAGLVHRDIKPENVIVRPDGYVKVLDFGLVKLIEREPRGSRSNTGDFDRTNPGTVLGTVAYMSPEQASGIEVDHRSDLFSLGVLMYELLTGVLPFKGNSTASILDAIVHHQPEPLTLAIEDTNVAEAQRILNRALEKERDLRYQTASDFRAELKRLQRELDSASIKTGITWSKPTNPRPFAWATPRFAITFALALLIIAVLCSAWMFLWREKIEPSPWLTAHFAQISDSPYEEFFPSLSPDGNTIVYARWKGSNWDIYSQRVGGFNAQNLTESFSGDDTQPAFSPDGAYIAFRSERDGGGVFVMGASGELVRRLSDRGVAYHPAWSPDSQEVIYTEEWIRDPRNRRVVPHRLWAVNIKTLEKRLISTVDAEQPQWSPNAHRLAYWGADESSQRDIWTMSPRGDNPVQVTNDPATDWNPIWSIDGKYLYFVSDRSGGMQLWRIAIDQQTGRALSEPELVPTPSPFAQHITLSRDGRKLAFSSVRLKRSLYRIEIDTRLERVIGEPEPQTQWSRHGMDLDVSPDGELLAYTTFTDSNEDLALLNCNGSGEPQRLTDDEYKDRGPRWSPDGKRIAFYSTRSGNFEIWLINADGTGLRRLTEMGNDRAFNPLWSPDGKRLNFTNIKGETWIIEVDRPWREQNLQMLNPERDPPLRFWPSAWSSDGRKLLGWSDLDQKAPGLTVYSFDTGQLEKISEFGSASMAWLQDNRRALFIVDGTVFITDTVTKKHHLLLSSSPDKIVGFRLSRNNRWIYYLRESVEADIWLLHQK